MMMLLVVLNFMLGEALASNPLPKAIQNVGIQQRISEKIPLDQTFTDENGQLIPLKSVLNGKPIILVFAYYKCPHLCTMVLNSLTVTLQKLTFNLGDQYQVLTVSIDPEETATLAAHKKAVYLKRYGKRGNPAAWHFLTGRESSIQALSKAAGFNYSYDPRVKEFSHGSGILILTPEGKISRYFLGIDYPTRDLRFALIEASRGRIGSIVDQILLFCYHYDPSTGKYGVAILKTIQITGALTLLSLLTLVLFLVYKERTRALS